MIEPDEVSKLLDQQAEKDRRLLVGRVLREANPFGPEGQQALAALRSALLTREP